MSNGLLSLQNFPQSLQRPNRSRNSQHWPLSSSKVATIASLTVEINYGTAASFERSCSRGDHSRGGCCWRIVYRRQRRRSLVAVRVPGAREKSGLGVLIKRYRKTIMQSPEGPSEAQWDVSWLDDTAISVNGYPRPWCCALRSLYTYVYPFACFFLSFSFSLSTSASFSFDRSSRFIQWIDVVVNVFS